jgi:ring-1,2-phenylacetyl-CoA epoxidase subunit PaaD
MPAGAVTANGAATARGASTVGGGEAARGASTGGGLLGAAGVVATVTDPELPMVTLAELGIVREVRESADGVQVAITPTYSGCPAMEAIRDDIVSALRRAGFGRVDVRTRLSPAWTTDWISESGRAKLAAAGIAPPGAAPRRAAGPIPLVLGARSVPVACPRCGHAETERISAFSATACRELLRCPVCREPFEHMKEI